MSRTRTSTALLLLASIALAGCTRNDPTAPSSSEAPQLAQEHTGADN